MSLFPTIIASLVVSLSLTNVTYTSLLMLVRIFGEPVPHSGLHIRPALSSRPFLYIFGECDTMRSLPIHPSPPRRLAGILSRRAFSFADIIYFATNCAFHFPSSRPSIYSYFRCSSPTMQLFPPLSPFCASSSITLIDHPPRSTDRNKTTVLASPDRCQLSLSSLSPISYCFPKSKRSPIPFP